MSHSIFSRKRSVNQHQSRLLQNAWANSYPTDADIKRLKKRIEKISTDTKLQRFKKSVRTLFRIS